MLNLTDLLSKKTPIVYDGATGTLLQRFGLPIGTAPEQWVLDNPGSVYAAAEAYVNAGSQIILTCTFGGTAFRLAASGLDARADEINRHAVELARSAAGTRALVAGSMGPLGVLALTMGSLTYAEAVEQFSLQAHALANAGVDFLQIESMSDLQEVHAAVQGAREATDLPIAVTMSFDSGGRTLVGVTPLLAARDLVALDLVAFGANCGSGPENVAAILEDMRFAAPGAVLIAKPNAGIPTVIDGQAIYSMSPRPFAVFAREWVRTGARIIGGCCGTTPDYIREISRFPL